MQRQRSSALTNNAAVNAVETVAATLQPISIPANDNIDLGGFVDITTGLTTTALVCRIRRGVDITGAVVATVGCTVKAAGDRLTIGIDASDVFANDVTGEQYVITIAQTGGTGNGAINAAYIGGIW